MQDAQAVPSPANAPRLRTLGTAALYVGDTDTPVLGPGKPLALLAYLDTVPGRRASREHLDALLWADREPLAARHALRQTIWYLRKRLGDRAFASDGDDVALTAPLASDRSAFLAAVEEGRLQEAGSTRASSSRWRAAARSSTGPTPSGSGSVCCFNAPASRWPVRP